jgi:hypothetical protein
MDPSGVFGYRNNAVVPRFEILEDATCYFMQCIPVYRAPYKCSEVHISSDTVANM